MANPFFMVSRVGSSLFLPDEFWLSSIRRIPIGKSPRQRQNRTAPKISRILRVLYQALFSKIYKIYNEACEIKGLRHDPHPKIFLAYEREEEQHTGAGHKKESFAHLQFCA